MYLYECIVHTIETFWRNAHAHSYPFYCTAFRQTHCALWRNDREEKKRLIIVGLALRFRVYAWRNTVKHSKKICTHCRPFSLTPHLMNSGPPSPLLSPFSLALFTYTLFASSFNPLPSLFICSFHRLKKNFFTPYHIYNPSCFSFTSISNTTH